MKLLAITFALVLPALAFANGAQPTFSFQKFKVERSTHYSEKTGAFVVEQPGTERYLISPGGISMNKFCNTIASEYLTFLNVAPGVDSKEYRGEAVALHETTTVIVFDHNHSTWALDYGSQGVSKLKCTPQG